MAGGAPDPTYSFPHNLVENVEALAKIVSEIQIEMRASKAEFVRSCAYGFAQSLTKTLARTFSVLM